MPLAPEDLARVQKFLEGKLKKCPMCEGHTAWILEPDAMALIKWAQSAPGSLEGVTDPRLVYPAVIIYCDYCGLSLTYSLNQILRSANAG
jgi:hypothetical protein